MITNTSGLTNGLLIMSIGPRDSQTMSLPLTVTEVVPTLSPLVELGTCPSVILAILIFARFQKVILPPNKLYLFLYN